MRWITTNGLVADCGLSRGLGAGREHDARRDGEAPAAGGSDVRSMAEAMMITRAITVAEAIRLGAMLHPQAFRVQRIYNKAGRLIATCAVAAMWEAIGE